MKPLPLDIVVCESPDFRPLLASLFYLTSRDFLGKGLAPETN
jgi:hypothetical protein